MIAIRLDDATLLVIDDGIEKVVYRLRSDDRDGGASDGNWWLISSHGDKENPLANFASKEDAVSALNRLESGLRDGETVSRHLAGSLTCIKNHAKPMWAFGAGLLALSLVAGVAIGRIGHFGAPPSPPSLPPSVFQGMMGGDDSGAVEGRLLSALSKTDSSAIGKASQKLPAIRDGYAVSPDVPIALPGEEVAPGHESSHDDGPVHTGASVDAMKRKLSILSGIDDSAPLPGSDIGSYRDIQKVMPDISSGVAPVEH